MILRIRYLHRTLRGYFVIEKEHSSIQIISILKKGNRIIPPSLVDRETWRNNLWSFTLLQALPSAYTNREAHNYTWMITKLSVIRTHTHTHTHTHVYQPPQSHITGKIYRHNCISSFCRHLCKFLQQKKVLYETPMYVYYCT